MRAAFDYQAQVCSHCKAGQMQGFCKLCTTQFAIYNLRYAIVQFDIDLSFRTLQMAFG